VRSPFPGMNPYLESHAWWTSFQTWFIAAWCEAIAEKLPDHYDANIAEQVMKYRDDLPGKLDADTLHWVREQTAPSNT
jgi:hypothetical protein